MKQDTSKRSSAGFAAIFIFGVALAAANLSGAEGSDISFTAKPEHAILFVIDALSYKSFDRIDLPVLKKLIRSGTSVVLWGADIKKGVRIPYAEQIDPRIAHSGVGKADIAPKAEAAKKDFYDIGRFTEWPKFKTMDELIRQNGQALETLRKLAAETGG